MRLVLLTAANLAVAISFLAMTALLAPDAVGRDLDVPSEFPTVSAAIDAARDGDCLRVAPAHWVDPIDFLGKSVTVLATDPFPPSPCFSAGEHRLAAGRPHPRSLQQHVPCGGALLFDNFEDGDDNGWNVLSGTWAVVDGVYRVRAHGAGYDALSTAGDPGWTSYRLEVDVRLLEGIDRCVNVRWADPASIDSNRYRVDFRHLGDVTVHRVVEGQSMPIASAPVSSEMDVWNRIGVEVSRYRIRVFVDGAQVLEASDSMIPHGAIALEGHPGSEGENELWFDNVHVVRIPELEATDDRIEELERLVGEQTVLLEELRNQTHDQEEAIANLEESLRGLVQKGRSVLRCLRQAGIPCDPDEGR